MKDRNLLRDTAGSSSSTIAKRKRSTPAENAQSKARKFTQISDADQTEDTSSAAHLMTIKLFQDFGEWASRWRAFQYQRMKHIQNFDTLNATEYPNEKYQSGYFTLGQQYTVLCIRLESSNPLAVFETVRNEATALEVNDPQFELALNRIVDSIQQIDAAIEYENITAEDKIFVDQFCSNTEKTDQFIRNNVLEFYQTEQAIQHLLQTLNETSTYFAYRDALTCFRDRIAPKIRLILAPNVTMLKQLQEAHRQEEPLNVNPVLVKRAKSVIDERILITQQHIEKYTTKINDLLDYCDKVSSMLTELEEIAGLLLDLDRRIPDNIQLVKDIEENNVFTPAFSI